jgi:hypothetical protein
VNNNDFGFLFDPLFVVVVVALDDDQIESKHVLSPFSSSFFLFGLF